jgi:hypothetical protein
MTKQTQKIWHRLAAVQSDSQIEGDSSSKQPQIGSDLAVGRKGFHFYDLLKIKYKH